jgi:hypothetical protein
MDPKGLRVKAVPGRGRWGERLTVALPELKEALAIRTDPLPDAGSNVDRTLTN